MFMCTSHMIPDGAFHRCFQNPTSSTNPAFLQSQERLLSCTGINRSAEKLVFPGANLQQWGAAVSGYMHQSPSLQWDTTKAQSMSTFHACYPVGNQKTGHCSQLTPSPLTLPHSCFWMSSQMNPSLDLKANFWRNPN